MPSHRFAATAAVLISVVVLGLAARGWRLPDSSAAVAPASTAPPAGTSPASIQPSGTAPGRHRTATGSAAAGRTNPTPTRHRISQQKLAADLTALFGPGDSFSVAGYDVWSGRLVRAGATSGMTEASLVKLDILETALYRAQAGAGFDSDDAAAMMEQSDNVAADQLFADDGGNSGLQDYHAAAGGMASTALDPNGTWGLSTTNAADQLQLLKQLVLPDSALDAASRSQALRLMGGVADDQRWGVSAAADPGSTSELKNGWLNIDEDDGRWAVNSAGLTTVAGRPVLLVVLSQHQPDFQTGVSRVEAAAKQLAAALA